MMSIDFYEKPTLGKEDAGYYDGWEIKRPTYIWHMYRDLEKAGVRFYLEMEEDGEKVHLTAKFPETDDRLCHGRFINGPQIGLDIDMFIQLTNTTLRLRKSPGTTVVKEELVNEDSISQVEELPQLQDDQLDTTPVESVSDRRIESGDGQSEHGREDDTSGCDLLGSIRIPS